VRYAALAVAFGATYRLRAVDAVHLATALQAGADRFLTNNRRDFARTKVAEIDVVHPDELAEAPNR
jgi:predicted nucleic acid-binding protein